MAIIRTGTATVTIRTGTATATIQVIPTTVAPGGIIDVGTAGTTGVIGEARKRAWSDCADHALFRQSPGSRLLGRVWVSFR